MTNSRSIQRRRRRCVGYPYAPNQSTCRNLTNRNPHWCDACDSKRIETITRNLKEMAENMRATGNPEGAPETARRDDDKG